MADNSGDKGTYPPVLTTPGKAILRSHIPSPPLSPLASPEISRTLEEGWGSSATSTELDPLLLRHRILPENDLAEIRNRKSKRGGKANFRYHVSQNQHIESLLKPLARHAAEAEEEEAANRLPVKIAVTASLISAVVLAVLQIYAAVASLSLSFFATASDAIGDPVANIILFWAHRKATRADPAKYPSGGARLETIGNVVFAFFMTMISVILVVESIQDIASHKDGELETLHVPAVVAVGVAFVTKVALFLYCWPLRSKNSQVHVLWEDHRNDLLVNAFGILTNSAGAKIKWWIDPMGAIIISVGLIYLWLSTGIQQLSYLAGKSAPADFIQLVIYKAMTFSKEILAIDNAKIYHSGENYVVEVDIVMDGNTLLSQAHDISQDLQDQLETLPRVERAYVHVDWEVTHKPEHTKKRA